jgi:hypothetical protein
VLLRALIDLAVQREAPNSTDRAFNHPVTVMSVTNDIEQLSVKVKC